MIKLLRVRYYNTNKEDYVYGESNSFNTHGFGEIIVYFDNDTCDSEYMHNFEVQLSSGEWKNMNEAFEDKDIIPDNSNTYFDFPHSIEEKIQGFNW